MIELQIIVSDDSDKSFKQKELLHEEGLCLSSEDPKMREMVETAISNFCGTPRDVVIKAKYTWDLSKR